METTNNIPETMKQPSIEERLRLFMQYPGQPVEFSITEHYYKGTLALVDYVSNGVKLKGSDALYHVNMCSLLLKPLGEISDEDKLHCYHLHSAYCKYDETQTYGTYLEAADHVLKQEGIKNMYLRQEPLDFLRSRSYALPYGSHSVEQLVEAGIYKLIHIETSHE